VGWFTKKQQHEAPVREAVRPMGYEEAGPYLGLPGGHHIASSDHIEQGYCERIDRKPDQEPLWPATAQVRGQGIELLVDGVLYSVADGTIPLMRKACALSGGTAKVLILGATGNSKMSKVYMRVR
jgi:hypothetical protein